MHLSKVAGKKKTPGGILAIEATICPKSSGTRCQLALHIDYFAVPIIPDPWSLTLVDFLPRSEFGDQQPDNASNNGKPNHRQANRCHDENHQGGNSQTNNCDNELAYIFHDTNPRSGSLNL